jgi:double zinc ribbon protein
MRGLSCGGENAEGMSFCEECGTKLVQTRPSCGRESRPTAKSCGQCGMAPEAAGNLPAAKSRKRLVPRRKRAACRYLRPSTS